MCIVCAIAAEHSYLEHFCIMYIDSWLILAGATLVFETELLKIETSPPVVNVFKEIDSDGMVSIDQ